jgi:hypothetical protein
MLKSTLAISVILALASATAVAQTSNKIHGTIRSIDSTNRTVTLENGQTVRLGGGTDMSGLKEGGSIDETCSGGTMVNCELMQPDTQDGAAQQNSPENQTAPSAGSNSTTNPQPSGTGTEMNNTAGTGTGNDASTGTTGAGGTNGSGSNSGSSN